MMNYRCIKGFMQVDFKRLMMKSILMFVSVFVCIMFFNVTKVEAAEIRLSVVEGQDITNELQNAIKQYDVIVIPKGNYYCSGVKLNGKSNLSIKATGATIIQNSKDNPIIYTSNGTRGSNISIVGGVWKGILADVPVMRFYGSIDHISLMIPKDPHNPA